MLQWTLTDLKKTTSVTEESKPNPGFSPTLAYKAEKANACTGENGELTELGAT